MFSLGLGRLGLGRFGLGMKDQSRRFCLLTGGQGRQTPALPNGFPALLSRFGHETAAFSARSMFQSRAMTGTLWGVPTGYIV
jgi:hypothetical protein